MQLNQYIDHTLLKPTATSEEITRLCNEAIKYHMAAVCVPPAFVSFSKELLKSTNVKTATVIGFPFGYSVTTAKAAEVTAAIADGVDELDMVINLISVRNADWKQVETEIALITNQAHDQNKVIKIIIESGILSTDEIITCCEICTRCKVDYVKTSTGYAEKGASIEAVRLMRHHLPAPIQIKASGGIRSYDFAKQLVEAGATRIGASSSVAIVEQQTASGNGY